MRNIEDVILKDGRSLKKILELHKKWLEGKESGKRANLSGEDLSYVDLSNLDLRYIILEDVDLSYANLSYANLRGADLKGANLRGAKLSYANLIHANLVDVNLSYADLKGVYLSYAYLENANLKWANLSHANLIHANLRGTNLTYTNLKGANLRGTDLKDANFTNANLVDANLKDVKYNNTTVFFSLQCPEEGSFVGYKKADNKIVKLLITKNAKRSSATTRECRCSKAKVLSITSLDGKEKYASVASDYDTDFIYKIGKIVQVKEFDDNRWKECAPGIHFFITRDEAVMY